MRSVEEIQSNLAGECNSENKTEVTKEKHLEPVCDFLAALQEAEEL